MPVTGGRDMSRDEYVRKLKEQIDQWNAQAARWDAQMKAAQGRMRQEYAQQLDQIKGRRDEMLYQLKLLQNASAGAWEDLARGADQAWKGMQEAFDRARSHFEKK
jgi:predicted  nucleic acid-binding Zn-ribbon protein